MRKIFQRVLGGDGGGIVKGLAAMTVLFWGLYVASFLVNQAGVSAAGRQDAMAIAVVFTGVTVLFSLLSYRLNAPRDGT